MGTTADKLNKLAETKSAIKQAIVDKGVKVADTDTFASYAEKIGEISTTEKKTIIAHNKMSFSHWTQEAIDDFDITRLDTSSMTNMESTFQSCEATSLDLSNFDTSNVTNMYCTFYAISVLALDLSSFNTSKLRNMSCMFLYTHSTSFDLTSFDVSNVTNINHAFEDCKYLTSIIGSHTIDEVEAGTVVALKGLKISLGLSSTKLERASLLAVIKGLADLTESDTTETLTLGSTLLAKLTDEDKQIATDKGWTLA